MKISKYKLPNKLTDSPAYKALNRNERLALNCIMEAYHRQSGYVGNGLPVTTEDLVRGGVHPRHVTSSLNVLMALGIIVKG